MDFWVTVCVGLGLILLGAFFMRGHIVEWQREKNDPTLDPVDQKHYQVRYRRRMQTSGMIILLGIVIPLGDWLLVKKFVVTATIIYFMVFGLIGWILLMAFGDMVSTKAHSQIALAKVRKKQRELAQEAADLRNQQNGNNRQSHSAN